MKMKLRQFLKFLVRGVIKPIGDIIISPLVFCSALILFMVKRFGLKEMNLTKFIFYKIGVFPILDHYYEPLFNPRNLTPSYSFKRDLPGIDLNIDEQLSLINEFHYNDEVLKFPLKKTKRLEYALSNGSFEFADGEFLYNMVRRFKPKRIIEVGCGQSTLVIQKAIKRNLEEGSGNKTEHICIEPYENAWLEELDVQVIRQKVELLSLEFFNVLGGGDFFFIDSSHIIRPEGDVLFEYLHILPTLKRDVIVHIHDIFTPNHYPYEWIVKDPRFWNEQYLLEGFLSMNNGYKIIGALNFLRNNFPKQLYSKCPSAEVNAHHAPGSFWIKKV